MSKYRYREVKNYIHNELKLTKEDINEIKTSIINRINEAFAGAWIRYE